MAHIPLEGNGKGDTPRPVDKKTYDSNWVKIFGKPCEPCQGTGRWYPEDTCPTCKGIGKVER